MIVWSRHSRRDYSETSWSSYSNALELLLADALTLEYYQLLWHTFDPMPELEMAPQSTLRPARLRMHSDYERSQVLRFKALTMIEGGQSHLFDAE